MEAAADLFFMQNRTRKTLNRCFSLLHSTLLEGGRSARGRLLYKKEQKRKGQKKNSPIEKMESHERLPSNRRELFFLALEQFVDSEHGYGINHFCSCAGGSIFYFLRRPRNTWSFCGGGVKLSLIS